MAEGGTINGWVYEDYRVAHAPKRRCEPCAGKKGWQVNGTLPAYVHRYPPHIYTNEAKCDDCGALVHPKGEPPCASKT